MKKTLLTLLVLSCINTYAQLSWQGGTNPEETDAAVLLFDATGTPLESYAGTIYAHTGVTIDDTTDWVNVIGSWGDNGTQPALSPVSGNVYSLTLSPSIQSFYSNPSGTITGIDIVLRSADAGTQTGDLNIDVGALQVTLFNPPDPDTAILVNSGGSTQVIAQSSIAADFELFIDGVSTHTWNNTTFYQSSAITGITANMNCELVVTQGALSITKSFDILVNNTVSQAMPGGLKDGINYDSGDATKATLVLNASLKDFVYVAGSFNSWDPDNSHAMKQDPGTGKFWLELTGLTSGTDYSFQYWVADQTPLSGSPRLVKTADPFSTLVLSPYDDPGVPSSSFPGIPTYPSGQEREVTWLKTGQSAYPWVVTNFSKPKKEDLIIYELLIRDFDSDRNFQDLIDRIDHFKDLNINAIQLMPIMEYEGNESWGYNTAFHMALDKFYGTPDKFKEFVDLCHQNGIAVILDIALNHATGRNPFVRMWMEEDTAGSGWGGPSSENPYFNEEAMHSYSVFNDFDHSQTVTKDYTKRVIEYWINEFKIDGFRWDLTKGFTQQCTASDESCTNGYRSDRVAVLKEYADYSWLQDPDHYVIFEHLGGNSEETEWANYRVGEGKGIMLWGKMTDPYNQLTMGYNSSNDISGMGHDSRGWTAPRLVGYSESHDEERLMYKNLQFGNSSGGYDVTNLTTALERMDALAAVSLTIPGPKMLWHFPEFGMENSIFTCTDGSVDDPDCKLSTKPQPQWTNNWPTDPTRSALFDAYARIIDLKINEDVFEGSYSITTNTLLPKIYIWDNSLPAGQLSSVVILANFDVIAQNITPSFPNTGTWYELMDESGSTTISGSVTSINLQPGEFRIYGDEMPSLSNDDKRYDNELVVYPNPTSNGFTISKPSNRLTIFDMTGKTVASFQGNFSKNHTFDTSNLTSGIYLINIEHNAAFVTRKLIIN